MKLTRRKIAYAGMFVFSFAIVALVGLQLWIGYEARSLGDAAAARFGGDRVEALSKLVGCERCDLSDRGHAVWALGELKDARALPALEARYTGARCDHAHSLCQYELAKAIRKIKGPGASSDAMPEAH